MHESHQLSFLAEEQKEETDAMIMVPQSIQAAIPKHYRLGNLQTTPIYFLWFWSLEVGDPRPVLLSEGLLPDS